MNYINFLLHAGAILFIIIYIVISSIGFFWFAIDSTTFSLYGISIISTISIFWAYSISTKLISKSTKFLCIVLLIIVSLLNTLLVFSNSQNVFDILVVMFSVYFLYILSQRIK
jgi:hypothetical protein